MTKIHSASSSPQSPCLSYLVFGADIRFVFDQDFGYLRGITSDCVVKRSVTVLHGVRAHQQRSETQAASGGHAIASFAPEYKHGLASTL